MRRFRLALLIGSCLASPAFAQTPTVPALNVDASATANANAAPGGTATANAVNGTGNTAGGAARRRPGTNVANTAQAQQQAAAASVPRSMPPAIDPVSPNKKMTLKERVGVSLAKRWINKVQTPHLDGDGVVHFTAGKGQAVVVTAVDHVTDIALAPGEIIAPPLHLGDEESWRFHHATSGNGKSTIAHILVKPIDAGLSTNMCDQPPVIPPDQFRITGDSVTWRPVQAYVVATPVGMKTCIEFPSSIGSEDLPALLALADDGGWFSKPTKKMINVRYVHRRFIADELLNRSILVDGVGGDQRSVVITRKKS
ncbi:MAG: TrbG/VirB9 family P-type conjugative transfer protein [Rhodopila sp.]